jgi:hypothetical protein
VLETGVADWSLAQSADSRVDTITLGQSNVRIGIADHAEVAIGWTPFATARTRDKATGLIDRQSGTGDVTLSVKRAFGDANTPLFAIKTYVNLPVGQAPSGAGDWSVGAQFPVALALSKTIQFSLTPEIDAAANGGGSGRHLAYGGAAGLGFKLSDAIGLGADIRLLRDDDPGGGATRATAGASVSWQKGENLQFDAGSNIGLNAASPDVEIYIGISKRF